MTSFHSDPEALEGTLAAYALGALPEDEHSEVEGHVRNCDECREILRGYEAVVSELAGAFEAPTSSPDLRDRIVSAVRNADGPTTASAAPEPLSGSTEASADRVSPVTPILGRRRWPTRSALALAAMLAVTIGLGWYAVQLRSLSDNQASEIESLRERLAQQESQLATLTQGRRFVSLRGTQGAPAASAVAAELDRRTVLVVDGLPPVPSGRVYQIWVIVGGVPRSAGILDLHSPTPTFQT
ncbi:MAG: anti-sigma factor, partial [Chloroflexi bacterium]|nr:anti-sigma factor [Chloroflexota bacterium]